MKIVERTKEKIFSKMDKTPAINQSKKMSLLGALIIVTILLIVWVVYMGGKADRTVKVVMFTQNIHKNQLVTESMLKPYNIIQAEYEKYTVVNENGVKKRRLILWDERGLIINSFAAYPLQHDKKAEYRDFIKSRVDNSDSVLYTFPGKDLIPLEISSSEMSAFKTFLKPGDRLDVDALFIIKQNLPGNQDYNYYMSSEQQEIFKTEEVFKGIMVADILNNKGESILDAYANYRELSVWEQAKLDNSPEFKQKTEPKTLLVALTPDEKERYYEYLSKSNIKFKASMPQRAN